MLEIYSKGEIISTEALVKNENHQWSFRRSQWPTEKHIEMSLQLDYTEIISQRNVKCDYMWYRNLAAHLHSFL